MIDGDGDDDGNGISVGVGVGVDAFGLEGGNFLPIGSAELVDRG